MTQTRQDKSISCGDHITTAVACQYQCRAAGISTAAMPIYSLIATVVVLATATCRRCRRRFILAYFHAYAFFFSFFVS
jgi:hypothetical protein